MTHEANTDGQRNVRDERTDGQSGTRKLVGKTTSCSDPVLKRPLFVFKRPLISSPLPRVKIEVVLKRVFASLFFFDLNFGVAAEYTNQGCPRSPKTKQQRKQQKPRQTRS